MARPTAQAGPVAATARRCANATKEASSDKQRRRTVSENSPPKIVAYLDSKRRSNLPMCPRGSLSPPTRKPIWCSRIIGETVQSCGRRRYVTLSDGAAVHVRALYHPLSSHPPVIETSRHERRRVAVHAKTLYHPLSSYLFIIEPNRRTPTCTRLRTLLSLSLSKLSGSMSPTATSMQRLALLRHTALRTASHRESIIYDIQDRDPPRQCPSQGDLKCRTGWMVHSTSVSAHTRPVSTDLSGKWTWRSCWSGTSNTTRSSCLDAVPSHEETLPHPGPPVGAKDVGARCRVGSSI